MGKMQLLNLILFWVFFGSLASYLGKKRGRQPLLWFFIGLTLGIIGVLLAVFLPRPRRATRPLPPPPLLQRSETWLKLWYYLDSKRELQGPIEFPDFAKLHKEKRISEKSYIWGEGMKEWKQLSELPELIHEMESA